MRSGISQHVVKGTHVKQDTAWCRMRFLKYECTSKGVRPKCVWKQHPLIARQTVNQTRIHTSLFPFICWIFLEIATSCKGTVLWMFLFLLFLRSASFFCSLFSPEGCIYRDRSYLSLRQQQSLLSIVSIDISIEFVQGLGGQTSFFSWYDACRQTESSLTETCNVSPHGNKVLRLFSANAVFFFRRSVISRAEMIMMLVNIKGNHTSSIRYLPFMLCCCCWDRTDTFGGGYDHGVLSAVMRAMDRYHDAFVFQANKTIWDDMLCRLREHVLLAVLFWDG